MPDYCHEFHCNADRRKPVGCDMCSCSTGREIQQLRKTLKDLWACPCIRADYKAMTEEPSLSKDAKKYHDALVQLRVECYSTGLKEEEQCPTLDG